MLAQVGSVNRREGEEKAAVALGVGSLGMRSSELGRVGESWLGVKTSEDEMRK